MHCIEKLGQMESLESDLAITHFSFLALEIQGTLPSPVSISLDCVGAGESVFFRFSPNFPVCIDRRKFFGDSLVSYPPYSLNPAAVPACFLRERGYFLIQTHMQWRLVLPDRTSQLRPHTDPRSKTAKYSAEIIDFRSPFSKGASIRGHEEEKMRDARLRMSGMTKGERFLPQTAGMTE